MKYEIIKNDLAKITPIDPTGEFLETIPETIRVILSEYVRRKVHPNGKGDKKG
ncbi:MAG: hypothetical protein WBE34_18675 [Candidatus Nitrosopolaris sp.]